MTFSRHVVYREITVVPGNDRDLRVRKQHSFRSPDPVPATTAYDRTGSALPVNAESRVSATKGAHSHRQLLPHSRSIRKEPSEPAVLSV